MLDNTFDGDVEESKPSTSSSFKSSFALGTMSDKKSISFVDSAIDVCEPRREWVPDDASLLALENLFQNLETADGPTGAPESSATIGKGSVGVVVLVVPREGTLGLGSVDGIMGEVAAAGEMVLN